MSQYRHLTAAELVRQTRAAADATPLERELADRLDLALRSGGTTYLQGLPTTGAPDAIADSEGGHHD